VGHGRGVDSLLGVQLLGRLHNAAASLLRRFGTTLQPISPGWHSCRWF